jgi:hypothetical protein
MYWCSQAHFLLTEGDLVMLEAVLKKLIEQFTDPLQLITMGAVVCLLLVIRSQVALLNRREDVLEKMASELSEHAVAVRECITLLEVLVYKGKVK